jgi:MFS transporter, CP family, cyanate transporter
VARSVATTPISGARRVASMVAPPALVAAGCLLIAANLRPAITTVGPLIDDIRADTGMSSAVAGLLTALPLLMFAAVSPLAPRWARRIGIERMLLVAMVVLAAGLVVRSAGPVGAIFAGTLALGGAIAVGNVLVPGLVKQDFPERAGLMTALYTTAVVGMAGLASGLSVPLADGAGLGWRGSLAVWAVPAAVAALVWWPVARRARSVPAAAGLEPLPRLRRSAVAWQVTLFMGFQSLLFHSLNTWLPALLADDGMSDATAGWMLGALQVASLAATMVVPIVAGRRRSQRGLVLLSTGSALLGLASLAALGASAALLSVGLLGLGTGACFSLALTFFVVRAADARVTAALSGMAQSLGYLLAATGPLLVGLLHDVTGSWDLGLVALAVATLGATVFGLGAARDRRIGGVTPTREEEL